MVFSYLPLAMGVSYITAAAWGHAAMDDDSMDVDEEEDPVPEHPADGMWSKEIRRQGKCNY